jgi:hypothetical protein
MPALIVTLNPAWKRPDWPQLQADASRLRQHQAANTLEPPSAAPADDTERAAHVSEVLR